MRDAEELGLSTERTGSGFSARMAAVAAAGLLLGVVGLGISGRSDAPPPMTPPVGLQAVVVAPSLRSSPPAAAQPGPTPRATRSDEPAGSFRLIFPPRQGPPRQDAFAVTMYVHGRPYFSVLREYSPYHLAAAMRLPFFEKMGSTQVQLIQLWTREARPSLADVASYTLALGELHERPPPTLLLRAQIAGRPRLPDAPRPLRDGYVLSVMTDVRSDHATLIFELTIGGGPRTSRYPLILLAGQAGQTGTPRGKALTGYGWVAGY